MISIHMLHGVIITQTHMEHGIILQALIQVYLNQIGQIIPLPMDRTNLD